MGDNNGNYWRFYSIRWEIEGNLDKAISKLQQYAEKYKGQNPRIDITAYEDYGSPARRR